MKKEKKVKIGIVPKERKFLWSAYCDYRWENNLNNWEEVDKDYFHHTLICFYDKCIILVACHTTEHYKVISYKEWNDIINNNKSGLEGSIDLYDIIDSDSEYNVDPLKIN